MTGKKLERAIKEQLAEIDRELDEYYSQYGCRTRAQRRALDHIQEHFSFSAIAAGHIEPIDGGVRFTDITGASGDFIYIDNTDSVYLKENMKGGAVNDS